MFFDLNTLCTILIYSLMRKKPDSTIVKKFISKKFRKYFIFLFAFYLIICLMKAKMNFEKIAILKTQELVFF